MIRAAILPSEVELTFLVSREGVATLSVDAKLAYDAAQALLRSAHTDITDWDLSVIDPRVRLEEGEDSVVEVSIDSVASSAATFGWPLFKAEHVDRLNGNVELKAQKTKAAKIPRGMAAIEGFTQVARSCLAQVVANADLLHGVRNPEALHQLRVGLRRLRAAFAAFRLILPREGLDRLNQEIKWISGELDPARDLDVFIKHEFDAAEANALSDPITAAFGDRLHLAQGLAHDQALMAVNSNRFAALLLDCTEWVEAAPRQRADNSMVVNLQDGVTSVVAVKVLKRFYRQLRKSGRHLTTLDAAGRHKVRIKAKRLRYAGEFFAETFGKSMHKRHLEFIVLLEALQDALGDLNDMATARRSALAVVGSNAALAFGAGLVVGGRERDEPLLLSRAVEAYEQWTYARPFWH